MRGLLPRSVEISLQALCKRSLRSPLQYLCNRPLGKTSAIDLYTRSLQEVSVGDPVATSLREMLTRGLRSLGIALRDPFTRSHNVSMRGLLARSLKEKVSETKFHPRSLQEIFCLSSL